mmetsp:Transcript_13863/g.19146  ORF Transcript_13863/g.19146 Transcript_13863/m.19146 type:complete len:86 (+) Transcript_13863:43-300(+)
MKVKINRWHSVGRWRWQVGENDMCAICRAPFEACCPECNAPGDNCPPAWGNCSHVLHLHCIEKWLADQTGTPKCPMCRAEWDYKS